MMQERKYIIRKILLGIAVELFAVLLQLSLKEATVTLVVGAIGLFILVFGLVGNTKNREEVLYEQSAKETTVQPRRRH